jgi:site-specific DNA-methyltransferase (adenine-specific)
MKLINNDCIAAMKEMPDDSVDSIVTDPPYELGFMGKSWDANGIAFNIEVWQQALRVLKPGGHLIAFSGSRTYHRMAVAIEDAGFQIRDQIMWVYGSGFPKSLDISKAIDKSAGAEREVIGETIKGAQSESTGRYGAWGDGITPTAPSTDFAKQWDGWGTALKPAHEPMVLARKPLEGTVANNVLTYGVGGLNIDATRVGTIDLIRDTTNNNIKSNAYASDTSDRKRDTTYSQNPEGRFPANFIHDGSDEVVAFFPQSNGGASPKTSNVAAGKFYEGGWGNVANEERIEFGSGSAARFFYCAKASKKDRNEGLDGFAVKGKVFNGQSSTPAGNANGSVEDKFSTSPSANHHPTVKPTSLMQYLVRLVTPPNGIVLDPFMGSGSTGKACAYEGFDFIGIDQSAEYVEIAQARIDFALQDKESELPL